MQQVEGIRVGPLTPLDPNYVSAEQRAAIEALAISGSTPHGHAAHSDPGERAVLPMWEPDQRAFDAQWSAAVAAVASLDSADEAAAAGYTRAAVQGPGVGVHWVNWTLIDQPFDPTRPAMLLFDERRDAAPLVGFSFWLRSDGSPQGFVGPNDAWHQHSGICVVNGWVDREVSTPDTCAGSYLGGNDLWMLHAWVVPGWENRWGPFAVMNPSLCPAATQASDAARCPAESTAGL